MAASIRIGADMGTGAGADTSYLSFAGLNDFASELLQLVAEMAQEAVFPLEEFERERRQLLESVRIERTTPSFLASERMRHVLFGAHPYAVLSPSEAQVAAFRRADLVEFYHAHYQPSSALLVLVGDFSSASMLAASEGEAFSLVFQEAGTLSFVNLGDRTQIRYWRE